jgi:hypothetical protein
MTRKPIGVRRTPDNNRVMFAIVPISGCVPALSKTECHRRGPS